MNIVNLCFYAEGYHSGAEYEENITVSEEFFEKIKEVVKDMEVYVYELDGKHSEVLGCIEVQYFSEEDIKEWSLSDLNKTKNDGESFYDNLCYACEDCELDQSDLDEEIKRIEKYTREICKQICSVTYEIPCDKKKILDDFVENLKK